MLTSQQLVDAAHCLSCQLGQGQVWWCLLAALNDLASGEPVPATAQELVNQATCLQSCIPQGLLPYVLLAAVQALSSGGGIGAVQVYQGAFADPNGHVTPDDTTKPALYFTDGGGTLWQFDVASQTWV